MDEEQWDRTLVEAARAYHAPPETPRAEMWQAIRRQRSRVSRVAPRWWPSWWLPWAAAAAAVLALGIGIGRISNPERQPAPGVVARERPRTARLSPTAYRLAALEHLSQSEEFLTLFRTAVGTRGTEQLASATARQLLATDRLLLDSPAASDPKLRVLLQDLELVLAEIAQLAPRPRAGDVELIRKGIERGGVLSRLRSAVPAGTTPTRGAL